MRIGGLRSPFFYWIYNIMATLTNNLNYLQPTSFKLVLDRKNYPNLEFFCQSVTHPGMLMSAVEVPFRKIAGVPMPGDTLTFNELSANIILDEDMEGYAEMYSWIRSSLDTNMGTRASQLMSEGIPHFADLTLLILSSHNNTTRQIKYRDCIPTSLGDISFESTSTGDTFITFNASFRFTYFELMGVNKATGEITESFSINR